ncbi:MAG: 4'-phosphopantetheinyl transferase superfamily protein [Desulfobacteraceae bacterium]|nr:4'-phosphopantetheinyl transferase superfamily protein [Desulfobacteraceae bacterium]
MKHIIGKNSAHLWWADLDINESLLRQLAGLLSKQEAQRAGRFVLSTPGRNFVAARGMLRLVLASYLEIPPAEVPVAIDARGKPYLKNTGNLKPIDFNLSHSGDMVLIGLTVNRRIGVDIERIRPKKNPEKIAERFFDPKEAREVAQAPENERLRLFLRYWTSKEAYLKATGDGIRRLKDIRVCTPFKKNDSIENRNWIFKWFSGLPGYEAAAVVEGGQSLEFSISNIFEKLQRTTLCSGLFSQF